MGRYLQLLPEAVKAPKVAVNGRRQLPPRGRAAPAAGLHALPEEGVVPHLNPRSLSSEIRYSLHLGHPIRAELWQEMVIHPKDLPRARDMTSKSASHTTVVHALACAALLNEGRVFPPFQAATTTSFRLFFSRSVPATCLLRFSQYVLHDAPRMVFTKGGWAEVARSCLGQRVQREGHSSPQVHIHTLFYTCGVHPRCTSTLCFTPVVFTPGAHPHFVLHLWCLPQCISSVLRLMWGSRASSA